MAGLQKYEGRGQIYVNGRLLAEATRIQFTVRNNDSQVMTMNKGMAGFADGATTSEGTVTTAIPRKGFEKNFVRAVMEREDCRIVTRVGGVRFQFEARFGEASWDQAADSATLLSAPWSGGEPKMIGG